MYYRACTYACTVVMSVSNNDHHAGVQACVSYVYIHVLRIHALVQKAPSLISKCMA